MGCDGSALLIGLIITIKVSYTLCDQNTRTNCMYRCAQFVTTRTEQNDHISSRAHALLKIAHLCVLNSCHPRAMSRSLPHLTLTTSTGSLSLTSPIFPTFSPSHPSPLAHDPFLPCEDPRQSGGQHKSHLSQVMSPK